MLFSFSLKAASICQTFLPLLYFHPETMLFYSPFFFSKAAPNHTMFVPFSPISGEFPLTSNFVRLKRSAKDDLHLSPKPLPDSKSIFPNKKFVFSLRQPSAHLTSLRRTAFIQKDPGFSRIFHPSCPLPSQKIAAFALPKNRSVFPNFLISDLMFG